MPDAIASATAHQLREHAAGRLRDGRRRPAARTARAAAARRSARRRRPPAARARAPTSPTSNATWCMPGPRLARNLPTGVSGPSDASSSTRPSPTRIEHGLDALVGHRLAVLELGAEQALVGLDRPVEVRDRDAEVMDPVAATARCYRRALAVRANVTIVERMRRVLGCRAAPLLRCCSPAAVAEGGSAPRTAIADKTRVRSSPRSSRTWRRPRPSTSTAPGRPAASTIGLNLHLVAGRGGFGHLSEGKLAFDMIRIGARAYFKGGQTFWANFSEVGRRYSRCSPASGSPRRRPRETSRRSPRSPTSRS